MSRGSFAPLSVPPGSPSGAVQLSASLFHLSRPLRRGTERMPRKERREAISNGAGVLDLQKMGSVGDEGRLHIGQPVQQKLVPFRPDFIEFQTPRPHDRQHGLSHTSGVIWSE